MAIATIGEAHDLGWRLTVYCRWGKRDGMKSIRECNGRAELDLQTLVWTRGRDFPIARLDSRVMREQIKGRVHMPVNTEFKRRDRRMIAE